MTNILSDYLGEIARIRATRAGTGEISYYGALAGAFNAAGSRLKPRVFCVPNLRNRGAGFPDMGLFVAARGQAPEEWPETQVPDRGVVEIDDIPADLSIKLGSEQVARYLARFGLVLVTNFRDFVLLGRDAQGRREIRERFGFGCTDAAAFFALARGERRPAGLAARFAEFLERVLLHQAPLAKPEDVAFFLASYARDARARIEEHASLPAFAELRAALQDALATSRFCLGTTRLPSATRPRGCRKTRTESGRTGRACRFRTTPTCCVPRPHWVRRSRPCSTPTRPSMA